MFLCSWHDLAHVCLGIHLLRNTACSWPTSIQSSCSRPTSRQCPPTWPRYCVSVCTHACLAISVIQHWKSRFAVLTFTMQIILIPFYVGLFLAFTSPLLIVLLVLCVCAAQLFFHKLSVLVAFVTFCKTPKRRRSLEAENHGHDANHDP